MLEELRNGCRSGEYYAPLQAYRSLIQRKATGPRKSFAGAREALLNGLKVAVAESCAPAATDLACMLFDVYQLLGVATLTADSWSLVKEAATEITALTSASTEFLTDAHRWATSTPRTDEVSSSELEWLQLRLVDAHLATFEQKKDTPSVAEFVPVWKLASRSLTEGAVALRVLALAERLVEPAERWCVAWRFLTSRLQVIDSRPSQSHAILTSLQSIVSDRSAQSVKGLAVLVPLWQPLIAVLLSSTATAAAKENDVAKLLSTPFAKSIGQERISALQSCCRKYYASSSM